MYAASVIGALRHAEGRYDEAIPLLRQALSGIEKIYEKDHAEVAQARVALAASLLGKHDAALRGEAAALIETAINAFTRAADAGTEPMLGSAYLERGRLHLHNGDRGAARADVGEAIARLQLPEHAPRLREAKTLARQIGVRPDQAR